MPDAQTASELDILDGKIEKLRERKRAVLKKASDRFSKLAADSGLLELHISDDDLLAALKDLAGRFRGNAKPASVPDAAEARPRAQAASK